MNKTVGGRVIGFERSRRLGVAEGFKGNATGNSVLAIPIDTTGLGFSSRAHDPRQSFADSQDGTIGSGIGLVRGWGGLSLKK